MSKSTLCKLYIHIKYMDRILYNQSIGGTRCLGLAICMVRRARAGIAIPGYYLQGPYSSGITVVQLAIAGGTVYATGGGRILALRP
jgi:hypothetical protein